MGKLNTILVILFYAFSTSGNTININNRSFSLQEAFVGSRSQVSNCWGTAFSLLGYFDGFKLLDANSFKALLQSSSCKKIGSYPDSIPREGLIIRYYTPYGDIVERHAGVFQNSSKVYEKFGPGDHDPFQIVEHERNVLFNSSSVCLSGLCSFVSKADYFECTPPNDHLKSVFEFLLEFENQKNFNEESEKTKRLRDKLKNLVSTPLEFEQHILLLNAYETLLPDNISKLFVLLTHNFSLEHFDLLANILSKKPYLNEFIFLLQKKVMPNWDDASLDIQRTVWGVLLEQILQNPRSNELAFIFQELRKLSLLKRVDFDMYLISILSYGYRLNQLPPESIFINQLIEDILKKTNKESIDHMGILQMYSEDIFNLTADSRMSGELKSILLYANQYLLKFTK